MKASNAKVSKSKGTHERSRAGQLRVRHVKLAHILQEFFFGLAQFLVPAGFTPKYLEELVAKAFVNAASQTSRCANGRVNRSRVAVLTALRRGEVTRLLAEHSVSVVPNPYRPRTDSVIDGWLSDPRFQDTNGKPRRIPITGPRKSFAALTKLFAGDVPYKAVLDELRRLDAVREKDGLIKLVAGRPCRIKSAQRLHEVLSLLTDSISVASQHKEKTEKSGLHRITLTTADPVDLQVLRQRATAGAGTFLEGLGMSLSLPIRPARRKKKMKNLLTVTVLIREQRNMRKSKK